MIMKTLSKILISLIVMSGMLITTPPTPSDAGPASLSNGLLTTTAPTLVEVGQAGLAIGVREPDSIGGVHVLPSTTSGLSAEGGQYWNQDHSDVGGVATAGDKFGDVVMWGDFNGDGFPDLAIGIPYDSENHGGMNVLYGTDAGISATGSQYFDQEILGVGMLEEGDLFGFSLAAGDFNHDGNDDLAIGAPGEAIGTKYNAGVVDVLYGSDEGLAEVGIGVQVFDQGSEGVYGDIEQADLFGFSLAVGDFNGDEFADLAVGVPYENIGSDGDAGQINMLYGSEDGLKGNDEIYTQDTFCEDCVAEQGDRFGFALAAGDFDGDDYDDLAIGVPYEYFGSTPNVGLVNILYGTDNGFEDRGTEFNMFNQDTLGIPGCSAENMDLFGYSLAAGDLNGDGYSDLVIGSPGESHWESETIYSYGVLNVMYGSATGLTTANAQWFHQDTPGMYGTKEASDQFGFTLAVSDLDGDGYDDLAVGVPYEDLGDTRDVGLVHMLYGTPTGLEGNAQWMNQETTGLGENEAYDMFGISLAIWPFPFPYTSTNNVYLPLVIQ
jgi:hypothetical protein